MSNVFESVARVAIEEMIKTHGSPSKFGIFFTQENVDSLTEDFYRLLQTSRKMKSVGDQLLAASPAPQRSRRGVTDGFRSVPLNLGKKA